MDQGSADLRAQRRADQSEDPSRSGHPRADGRQRARGFDAGASVMHVHYRMQEKIMAISPAGILKWPASHGRRDPRRLSRRDHQLHHRRCRPGRDRSSRCVKRVKPEIAACNAGSLNYLKLKRDGSWAWPPMMFDNPVEKVQAMLDAMADVGAHPEFECFDVGIVRCVNMYIENGMAPSAHYNFVMGVASGMPVDAQLLKLLLDYKREGDPWQTTLDRTPGNLAGSSGDRRSWRYASHRT
jgi:3-keto-5-aminohexanoate cleavage enzyme